MYYMQFEKKLLFFIFQFFPCVQEQKFYYAMRHHSFKSHFVKPQNIYLQLYHHFEVFIVLLTIFHELIETSVFKIVWLWVARMQMYCMQLEKKIAIFFAIFFFKFFPCALEVTFFLFPTNHLIFSSHCEQFHVPAKVLC